MIDLTKARAIPGWMARRELRWLAEQAQVAQAILEIGCSRGRSTRALGDHTAGVVHSIDSWHDPLEYYVGYGDWAYATAQANLADLIQAGRVVLHRGWSVEVLATWTPPLVDLVFIDGDHSYEGVAQDLKLCRQLLRNGGILSGHDYNSVPRHAGVREAVDALVGPTAHVGSIWWTTV